jgi:hypothetical protein
MRRKRTGTYDHSTATWKLRTSGESIQISTRQLSKHFGVDVPKNEQASLPFWLRYLAQVRKERLAEQAKNPPAKPEETAPHQAEREAVQTRIHFLESLIDLLEIELDECRKTLTSW